MPATRLLVIADSKMLPALANGLRDSAKFDVHTMPLSDLAGAQAAAEKADAVALFYGAPGSPLPAAVQALSSRVRERGGRVIAVLQREQTALRDDCFRAGASDLLFMPMPKDQFVGRLLAAVALSWVPESGAPAPVSVATRTATSRLEKAQVSLVGIESAGELPLKAGETVRVQWATFQSWGLVLRGTPSTQIRFAGLAPEEEGQIRDWLKAGAPFAAPEPAAAASPAVAPPAPAAPPPAPASAAKDKPTPAYGSEPVGKPAGGRAAPAAGPPPGFADRKPIRPVTRTSVRVAPPVMAASGGSAPSVSTPARPATSPPVAAPSNGAPPAAAPLSGLFEDGAAPSPAAAQASETSPAQPGPPWPVPVPLGACKAAALLFLKDKGTPPDLPPAVAQSVRKVTGMLGSAERNALERTGPESHLADALAARIALDAATSEGVKLYSSSPAAVVDSPAVAALARQADEAVTRLQKEANAAVGKGEVESLQMVTAASAALSRDLLNFKETADRLRGLSAAPRLGGGALDPDMVLPGQAPRPRAAQASSAPAPVRAELRDFHNLDGGPGRGKRVMMIISMGAFLVALANALYFGLPRHTQVAPEVAGRGVERIDVSGDAALVTVSPAWLEFGDSAIPPIVAALKNSGAKKAILILPNGVTAGVVDLSTGRISGQLKPRKPAPPPAPK